MNRLERFLNWKPFLWKDMKKIQNYQKMKRTRMELNNNVGCFDKLFFFLKLKIKN